MSSKSIIVGTLALIINLSVIYFVPRVLSDALGPANPWTSFWFQYIVGFMIFINGIWLVMKAKACVLSRKQDLFWFKVMWAGLACYFVGHMAWILIAQNVAVRS